MLWVNLKRIFKTGFLDFWRNAMVSLSAVLVMVITLLILASVVFSSALLNHTLVSLQEKIDVNINFMPDVAIVDVEKVRDDLEVLPQVELVELLTREQVLENFIANNQGERITLSALELLDDNPFGASLRIKAVDLDQYEPISNFLVENYSIGTPSSMIDDVNFSDKQLVIERLGNIISAGEKFGAIVTVLFVILSILITLNTIRLAMYISRHEIKVMNLVGAEHSYISGPFIVAGAIYGLVSSFVVLIILYPITFYIGKDTARLFFDLNLFSYYISNFAQIFFIIVVSGILIGSISSFLAVKKYLKEE